MSSLQCWMERGQHQTTNNQQNEKENDACHWSAEVFTQHQVAKNVPDAQSHTCNVGMLFLLDPASSDVFMFGTAV